MDMSLNAVVLGGILTLLVGVFHLRFYALFGWHSEFEVLSEWSRRIVFTIHLGLLLMFFGVGGLCLVFAGPLATGERLALGVDLLLAVFWGWRAVWQLAYFKPPLVVQKPMQCVAAAGGTGLAVGRRDVIGASLELG